MYGKNRIPGREACTMIFWLVWLDWQAWKREFSTALESQQKKKCNGDPKQKKKKIHTNGVEKKEKKDSKQFNSQFIVKFVKNQPEIQLWALHFCVWLPVCVTSWTRLPGVCYIMSQPFSTLHWWKVNHYDCPLRNSNWEQNTTSVA